MKKAFLFAVCAASIMTLRADCSLEEWNLKARKAFADQRFGVFIHWGLYANYAQGEWYLQQCKLDEKAYSRMMYGFCPSKFDAKGKRPAIDLEWYEGLANKPRLPKGYRALDWDEDIPAAKGSTAEDAAKNLTPGKLFELSDGTAWQGGSHSAAISICGSDATLPDYPEVGSNHYANFLLAVMGKEETRSPFAVAGPLSEVFCLGCIAQRLNRGFKFDPAVKRILGDAEAEALLRGSKGTPRKGWEEFYKV